MMLFSHFYTLSSRSCVLPLAGVSGLMILSNALREQVVSSASNTALRKVLSDG